MLLFTGKKAVKLEITIGQRGKKGGSPKGANKRSRTSGLETKLDELRIELSSSHGGIFPHAVLSMQQINMLGHQKPTSIEEVSS